MSRAERTILPPQVASSLKHQHDWAIVGIQQVLPPSLEPDEEIFRCRGCGMEIAREVE